MNKLTSFIKKFYALIAVLVVIVSALSFATLFDSIEVMAALTNDPTLAVQSNKEFIGVQEQCQVIINGGTTAALMAAFTAAKETQKVCLLEPTDWIGGQLTASGVPAIDWQWMSKINEKKDAAGVVIEAGVNGNLPHRLRENNNFQFYDWIKVFAEKASCSVSRDCFTPLNALAVIKPAMESLPNLKIFYNTVVKTTNTVVSGTRKDPYTGVMFPLKKIKSIGAIQRTPVAGLKYGGYDVRLSSDILDWYTEGSSARFTKMNRIFEGVNGKLPVVIEASDTTDVLILSGGSYLQGEEIFDGSLEAKSDVCGQAFTMDFNVLMNAAEVPDNGPGVANINRSTTPGFNYGTGTWDTNWNYRRIKGTGSAYAASVAPGQMSLINWKSFGNNGNDHAEAYYFKNRVDTLAQLGDWKGGVDANAIKKAEDQSYNFFYFMKDSEPRGNGNRLSLANDSMGTGTGLYKMPYLRDISRTIGIDNYVLKTSEMLAQKPTGYRFMDRIATANYPFDIHPNDNCTYSDDTLGKNFTQGIYAEPYPFYISFRSLTNRNIENLVVGGKAIAQSFKASAATRLQPGEATTGAAAGAVAAYMFNNNVTTYEIVEPATGSYRTAIAPIQTLIKKYQAIDWTIDTVVYPSATEYLPDIRTGYYCPNGAIPDLAEGYCVDATNAYGPFSNKMVDTCVNVVKGGPACTELKTFTAGDKTIKAQRWGKLLTRQLRKGGVCMDGLSRDTFIPNYCVAEANPAIVGDKKQVYGPFTINQVNNCSTVLIGGQACFTNRYGYDFTKNMLVKTKLP
jgi:FAD dependent oxidoreductase